MAHRIPTARYGFLQELNTNGTFAETIFIGLTEWYVWLEQHRSFRFETECTTLTARKEQRPGGWYWYAYRRKQGKLHTAYLGKSEELSLERLNTVAEFLEHLHTCDTTDSVGKEHRHLVAREDILRQISVTTLPATFTMTELIKMPKPAVKSSAKFIQAIDRSQMSSSEPIELTRREHEVLQLLTIGLTSAHIAKRLVVSLSTVNTHIRSIYTKFGVTSRSAATRYAVEHHLV